MSAGIEGLSALFPISLLIKFVKEHPDAVIPQFQTSGSGCFDLVSVEEVMLIDSVEEVSYRRPDRICNRICNPVEPVSVGFSLEIPKGWIGLIFARSGLAKEGVHLGNGVAVIDNDFRGLVKVLLQYSNYDSESTYKILPKGTRIAQMMFIPQFAIPNFIEVEKLSETARGEGGFGSTGLT